MDNDDGQPIPFIEIQEIKEEKRAVFSIHPDAIHALQNLNEKKIAVIAFSGPKGSGKSFLANRFLNKMKGFPIKSSTNDGTRGIWMWSKPIQIDKYDVILLDTEGLNAIDRDKSIDMKIFTLSILLSSMFIYNSMGQLDTIALENLSLITELSKCISISEAHTNIEDKDLIPYLPYFIWVLRDFPIELKGKTAKEYLEAFLTPVAINSPKDETNNLIRGKFNNYFKSNDCQILVKPLLDESKLNNIDEQQWDSMKALFRLNFHSIYWFKWIIDRKAQFFLAFPLGVKNFMDKVYKNLQIKCINNKPLTGNMFLNLAFEYVQAMNDNYPPEILTCLERIISTEIRKTTDELYREYCDKAAQDFGEDQMPLEEEQIQNKYKSLTSSLLQKFDKHTKDIGEVADILELRSELIEKMEKDLDEKLSVNDERSQDLCKKLINELINQFKLPSTLGSNELKESIIKEHRAEFIRYYENYKEFARGPHKYDIFGDCMPNFLFDYFEKYHEGIKKILAEEISQIRVDLTQAKSNNDIFRGKIQEQDALIFEYQKEKETYKRELEKNEREYNSNLRKKTNDIQFLSDKIKDLETALERKKKKIQDLKKGKFELDQTIERMKIDFSNTRKQNEMIQAKLVTMEKDLIKAKSKVTFSENGHDKTEIAGYFTNLRNQIDVLNVSIPDRDSLEAKSHWNDQLIEKEKEIARLKVAHAQDIRKAKEEYKDQLNSLKDKYAKEREDMNKQNEKMMNSNSKLKLQIMELDNYKETIIKKDELIEALKEEKKSLSDALNSSENRFKTNVDVLEVFKGDIEKKTNKIAELEMAVGLIKSENSDLKSKKYDLLYAAKEAIKRAAGVNSHQLKQALRNLQQADEGDANEIRNALRDAGRGVNYQYNNIF